MCLVKKYQDLLKGVNRKIRNTVGKQGELLKRFLNSEDFFDCLGLSRLNIYFKKSLYKFLCKFLVLKNWTLTSSYLRAVLSWLKKYVRQTETYLVRKSKKCCSIIFYFFYPCLDILSSLESHVHGKVYSWKILSSLENFIQ